MQVVQKTLAADVPVSGAASREANQIGFESVNRRERRAAKSKRKVEAKAPAATKSTTTKQPLVSNQPQSKNSSTAKSLSKGRRSFRTLKWLFGTVLGAIGLTASVYQLCGGPPWSVPPSFSPGEPSYASPLDVPFSVSNRSGLVPIKNAQITCILISMTTIHDNQFSNLGFSIVGVDNEIAPGDSDSYTCPFNRLIKDPNDQIVEAKIRFESKYDSWLWPWKETQISPIFSLDTATFPPRWTEGNGLQ